MTEYDRRFDAAVQEMDVAGLWKINSIPPYIWFFRALRFSVRPLHYVTPWKVFIGETLFFAALMGFINTLFTTGDLATSVFDVMYKSLIAGGLFGLFMLASTILVRKRHNLSRWDSL